MTTRSNLSRRRFLKAAATTAAIAGFPTIVPSSALGDSTTKPASERLTLGFIGIGTQARGHLTSLLGKSTTQVLAVCDVDKTRREHALDIVKKKYADLQRTGGKSCEQYVDYRELLARKDIDAVVIGTPDHWHAAPIIEAAKAKKDIYCEKPLTLTIGEAKACVDAVRKHNIVFQTGSQQRSSKEFRTAVEYVRSGRLGKIKQVLIAVGGPSKPCDLPEEPMEAGLDWDKWLGPAPMRPYNSILSPRGIHKGFPAWRNYREYSGGGMTDFGAHHYDIAQWGLDMDSSGPVEVRPPEDPKANKGCKFLYANGIEMIHGMGGGITFIGELGQILVNRGKLVSTPESILMDPLTDKDVKVYLSNDHRGDWLDCIKTRKRPICDVEIGARTVTICHLANFAYWNRKPLKWDPQKWEFTGENAAEANGWRTRERRKGYELPTA